MASAAQTPIQPIFSHGASPAVVGSTTNSGRAIAIYRAAGLNWPAMAMIATGAMTVKVEVNPGPLLSDGNPDPANWIEIGEVVFAGAGTSPGVAIPPTFPYVRTRISAHGGGGALLSSCVPCIPLSNGDMASAQYPTLIAGAAV